MCLSLITNFSIENFIQFIYCIFHTILYSVSGNTCLDTNTFSLKFNVLQYTEVGSFVEFLCNCFVYIIFMNLTLNLSTNSLCVHVHDTPSVCLPDEDNNQLGYTGEFSEKPLSLFTNLSALFRHMSAIIF